MRYIPLSLLSEILKEPFYEKCCLCGGRPVQLHHNFIFAGGQVNEKWCILPLCPACHSIEKRKDIHERLDWISLSRATDEELKKYSKVDDLIAKRERLKKIYA